jgi:hypothetical protein
MKSAGPNKNHIKLNLQNMKTSTIKIVLYSALFIGLWSCIKIPHQKEEEDPKIEENKEIVYIYPYKDE